MRLGTTTLIVLPPALACQLARFPARVCWQTTALWVLLADPAPVAAVLTGLWLTDGALSRAGFSAVGRRFSPPHRS